MGEGNAKENKANKAITGDEVTLEDVIMYYELMVKLKEERGVSEAVNGVTELQSNLIKEKDISAKEIKVCYDLMYKTRGGINMLNESTGNEKLTLEDAKVFYDLLYPFSDDKAKVELKCWMYYVESRSEGGKLAMTFYHYIASIDLESKINLIKSLCIDTSDLGGKQGAITALCGFKNSKEG